MAGRRLTVFDRPGRHVATESLGHLSPKFVLCPSKSPKMCILYLHLFIRHHRLTIPSVQFHLVPYGSLQNKNIFNLVYLLIIKTKIKKFPILRQQLEVWHGWLMFSTVIKVVNNENVLINTAAATMRNVIRKNRKYFTSFVRQIFTQVHACIALFCINLCSIELRSIWLKKL